MALKSGTRVGPYEIRAAIGAGGMGEVYRATDTKLGRDVALKVLPDPGDRSRLTRFEVEARALASLSHPHIASIHGLEELGGVPCLVLELVEGQTLSQRLSRGALPPDRVVDLGRQIASALEAAHDKGILHRDLKPANIMVTSQGTIKVLDFGLAKILHPEPPPVEASRLPTISNPVTREGLVLGTAPYMSPEQVRGEPLDFRSDIWSFGCVLYEMATGTRAFPGKTAAESIAAILQREPDWGALRGRSTTTIERLIRRCLRKELRDRLHDIADARIELEEARSAPPGEAVAGPERRGHPWIPKLLWMLAGMVATAAAAILLHELGSTPLPPRSPIVRASLTLPSGPLPIDTPVPSLTVSPDGRTVVFRGKGRLYRRALDEADAESIPGSEGGWAPAFSPDGEWLAFFAGMRLLKLPVAGGTPITLCSLPPVSQGLSWAPDGRIIFARSFNGPLYSIAEGGGEPQIFTRLEPDEQAHLYPQALPGARLLFTALVGRDFQDVASARIMLLDLETGERRVLLEGATFARYAGDGWILFVRGQSVFAAPVDLARAKVTAPPVALSEPFAVHTLFRTAHLAVSNDGTLVYVRGPAVARSATEVLSLDSHGVPTALAVPPGVYSLPALSPDGRRLALQRCEAMRCTAVVFDRDRQLLSSVVPEPGRFFDATWSPDGRRLALASVLRGDPRLVVRAADGSGSIESPTPLTEDAEVPNSWSPDGRTIAYTVVYTADRGGSRVRFTSDIWLAAADGSSPPQIWIETPHSESGARFSPDGRYLAYVSDESGRKEVYARPLNDGGRVQISSEGGIEPVWAARGRSIFYRRGNRFFAVDLGTGSALRPGPPRLLFEERFDSSGGQVDEHHTWDVSADGEEMIVVRTPQRPEPERALIVVTGWLADLERRSPR